MKKLFLACVGFSLLCLAFSCGQQAFKQPANAAGDGQAGSQWVHAQPWDIINKSAGGQKGLLNLQHVTFIQGDGMAIVPMPNDKAVGGAGEAWFKIEAADIPK